ncbi:MAG TPA: hypothetical protein VEL10_06045 [Gaiellaceae bacterium]|nr:hypothetical protein [Gaiellaceae bacterium]
MRAIVRKPKRELEVTMFTNDPLDALVAAHERARQLRAEAAAERLRGTSGTRRALAVSLRRAADRLDPAPLGRRTALALGTPVKER